MQKPWILPTLLIMISIGCLLVALWVVESASVLNEENDHLNDAKEALSKSQTFTWRQMLEATAVLFVLGGYFFLLKQGMHWLSFFGTGFLVFYYLWSFRAKLRETGFSRLHRGRQLLVVAIGVIGSLAMGVSVYELHKVFIART